jgi:ubiquinone/menaquinone biosynthesis C-methylase UbiE
VKPRTTLNPAFSKEIARQAERTLALPENLRPAVAAQNTSFDTGMELRVQEVYTDEIWRKLDAFGLAPDFFAGKRLVDLCCGSGFLAYHLLRRIAPAEVSLLDISPADLEMARSLLCSRTDTRFLVWDLHEPPPALGTFDVVLGNSFLHHFYDLPKAVEAIASMLRPGGTFLALHEPTPAAIALEGGSRRGYVKSVISPGAYIDTLRYTQGVIAPNSGADVWMFTRDSLEDIFRQHGFEHVECRNWGLCRPLVVARQQLHLRARKPTLSRSEVRALSRAVNWDAFLSRFAPSRLFGSIALMARQTDARGA